LVTASIIILGAGAAGLAAARALSPFHRITIVEERAVLGGMGERISCANMDGCSSCGACNLPELAEQVMADPNVDVLEGTVVTSAQRDGQGDWVLGTEGNHTGVLRTDAVLVSTGLDVDDGASLVEYGVGQVDDVMTALDLDQELKGLDPVSGAAGLLGDGLGSMAIVQCTCATETGELPYCSKVCCAYTARLALEVRARYPSSDVTVYHGELELDDEATSRQVARAMEDPGIEYTRARPAAIQPVPGGGLEALFMDMATGDVRAQRFDAIVLSTGLVPSAGTRRYAELFGLPMDEHGFVMTEDARPGTTSVAGVYVAGGVSGPMDLMEASSSGMAAAGSVLNWLPPTWKRAPRVLLFGQEEVVHGAGHAAEGMGAEVLVFEGIPAERLNRLDGEVLDFSASVDDGRAVLRADAVVVAAEEEPISEMVVPGSMTFEEAWRSIEAGTLRGRIVLLMGNDTEALLLARAILGMGVGTVVDVLHREMSVVEGGVQELQFDLSSSGVRFHRYSPESFEASPRPEGGYLVRYRDELHPERGEMLIEADMVVAPSASARDGGTDWSVPDEAPEGVKGEGRHNLLPVFTPRRGVYTGTPGPLMEDTNYLGGIAAVTMALSDYARGFPVSEEVAEVDPDQCSGCRNCVRVCPHDAIVFDEDARMARILKRACQSCGLCTSSCPALAIRMVPGGEVGNPG
jgi:heterodisulfide reductase subunit A